MHDFTGMGRVFFFDRDNRQVVEYAMDRQIHIDDFRQSYAEQWKKQSFRRFAEVSIFHGRTSDDGRRINWIISMSDAGHMKNRIIVSERVESCVVAERPLAAEWLSGVDITFDDNI